MSCSSCASPTIVAPLVPAFAPYVPLAAVVAPSVPLVPYLAPVVPALNLAPYLVAPSIASSWALFQASLGLGPPIAIVPAVSTPCCGGSSPVLYRVK